MAELPKVPEAQELCDPKVIVSLLREGDIAALDRITRCYGDRLVRFGRRRCADKGEDAVQDALLSANEHLRDYRGEGSVEGWLLSMVANACSRMQRGRKNARGLHVPIETFEAPSGDDPEAWALRNQYVEMLVEALEVLPPADRAMIMLSDGEGWKGPEIAQHLGMTPAAVRTRLSRARKKLRAEMQVVAGHRGLE